MFKLSTISKTQLAGLQSASIKRMMRYTSLSSLSFIKFLFFLDVNKSWLNNICKALSKKYKHYAKFMSNLGLMTLPSLFSFYSVLIFLVWSASFTLFFISWTSSIQINFILRSRLKLLYKVSFYKLKFRKTLYRSLFWIRHPSNYFLKMKILCSKSFA